MRLVQALCTATLALALASCGGSPAPQTAATKPAAVVAPLTSALVSSGTVGSQFSIHPMAPPMGDRERFFIEQSEVWTADGLKMFYDPTTLGDFYSVRFDGERWIDETYLGKNMRFFYVMEVGEQLLAFSARNGTTHAGGGTGADIYLDVSEDGGATWTAGNDGLPALTHSADKNSVYYNIWNVGVAAQGTTLHLLVETADGFDANQSRVGLAYSRAIYDPLARRVNFDGNRAGHVIPQAGNPWLYVDDSGSLIALHGLIVDGYWLLTASTRTAGTWTTHREKFQVAQQGIHVGDPAVYDYPRGGATRIVFSRGQVPGSVTGCLELHGAMTLKEFAHQLLN